MSDDDVQQIRDTYHSAIVEIRDECLEQLTLDQQVLDQALLLGLELLRHPIVVGAERDLSGVVLVGYGDAEVFPQVHAFIMWGMAANHLLYAADPRGDQLRQYRDGGALRPARDGLQVHGRR